MKKRQKGSITVEATLFLPLFFLAFVSIYSLISFTRAQLIVQYAADQAAKKWHSTAIFWKRSEFWILWTD